MWHGCPTCFPIRTHLVPGSSLTMEDAYQSTIRRQNKIEDGGYKMVVQWECEFKQELKEDPEMKDFVDSVKLVEPLDGRDGFYGGRTNAIKLYHNCEEEGEKIHYVDFTSLYPSVQKYGEFPIGVPEVTTSNFKSLEDPQGFPYFGMMKCRVLPPRGLYHPVLPYRAGGKLMFPLCGPCADEKSLSCNHSDEDRAFIGTWCTPEVEKAMEKGYKVLEIFEVWDYEKTSKFDGEDQDTGLFTKYVNTFLKLKQEADGWPSWVKTEEDKDLYIEDYEKNEGIHLDKEKIQKNPGLRSLAKLMLNSFW